MLRFPRPLTAGDTIALTAPSAGVPAAAHGTLDACIANLQSRGFHVREGECLRQSRRHISAPAAARAAELEGFLTDASVAAVLPPWGGEFAIDLLPLLDFERIGNCRPVWFCGFSDISTLQLPLAVLSGWASLHGPNLMQLAGEHLDPWAGRIFDVLTAPTGASIEQVASASHQGVVLKGVLGPDRLPLRIDVGTRWHRLDGAPEPLDLHGRLIGGCLDTLSRLAGTIYGDLPALARRAGIDGLLLFLENAEMKPTELVRALASLKLHGWFDAVSAVLLGRNAGPDKREADALGYREALHRVLDDIDRPVLIDLDIGHKPPQMCLVQGALADVSSEGAGRIRQRLV